MLELESKYIKIFQGGGGGEGGFSSEAEVLKQSNEMKAFPLR